MKYLVDIMKKRIRLSDILIILTTHHVTLGNTLLFEIRISLGFDLGIKALETTLMIILLTIRKVIAPILER